MKRIVVCMLAVCALMAIELLYAADQTSGAENSLLGKFEYSAFYESGSKTGTWTRNHRMSIDVKEGDYYLNWGSLRVKTQKIANGLIYKWDLGNAHGEGIYLFYNNNTKLFGTFRLTDENGEHAGYTEGNRLE